MSSVRIVDRQPSTTTNTWKIGLLCLDLKAPIQYALVPPVVIIDNDHHLARTHRRNGILDTRKSFEVAVSCRHDLKLSVHMPHEIAPLN